jgi:homocysteine S-methyltransferase
MDGEDLHAGVANVIQPRGHGEPVSLHQTNERHPRLPQLRGEEFVTDGGIETDLIYHHGVDLPHFAAFPLVGNPAGQALLTRYYGDYAAIARRAGAGLLLETPTWRANHDWGARLGYGRDMLQRANVAAVDLLHRLRGQHEGYLSRVLVGGVVGPRESGWSTTQGVDPAEAATYHGAQVHALANAGVDLVSAHTLSEVGEAVGVVWSAREHGLPVAIAFTVEVNGRLPDGMALREAMHRVDAAAPPDYFIVNCAHPTHIARALSDPGSWRRRVAGCLANASTMSHAEFDAASELDEGNPQLLATDLSHLRSLLPGLAVVGGCCGTDARHVAAMWGVA